jgi:kynurenine formamidase
MSKLTADQVLELLVSCSNAGRWGEDDELGTINYITPDVRLAAIRTVTAGVAMSIGKDLVTKGSRQTPPSAVHFMTYAGHEPTAALDTVVLTPHGLEMTHVDAVGHSYFEGRQYNNRTATTNVTADGIGRGSIMALADGLVTRGVLLDVAASRGLDFLPSGSGVTMQDVELAEKLTGTRVGRGDAIFIRTGIDLQPPAEHDGDPRTGVLADVVPWLHEREVAIYSGDCIERTPSGHDRVPMPLHQIGLVAMGLCMLDSPDVEKLLSLCKKYGRHEFLLAVAPLRIPGGTGSSVNPIVVF